MSVIGVTVMQLALMIICGVTAASVSCHNSSVTVRIVAETGRMNSTAVSDDISLYLIYQHHHPMQIYGAEHRTQWSTKEKKTKKNQRSKIIVIEGEV